MHSYNHKFNTNIKNWEKREDHKEKVKAHGTSRSLDILSIIFKNIARK